MFRNVTRYLFMSTALLITACGGGGGDTPAGGGGNATATIEEVGQLLFEDTSLSANGNQACATCHDSTHGFADPNASITAPVSEGSIGGRFGNRNAPTAAYARFTPAFRKDCTDVNITTPTPCGGQFLDGRRDSLENQARDPFLNDVEMANNSEADVVAKVQNAPYADKFRAVFGADVFNNVNTAYDRIVEAIAAYERTAEFAPFDSKFDCFLQDPAAYPLDDSPTNNEKLGFELFIGEARCSICHSVPTHDADPNNDAEPVLFTNFMYFNIGVPRNLANPQGASFTDLGLGTPNTPRDTPLTSQERDLHRGKFKTPTLRNIALTAPYMHNGVFRDLQQVVEFYFIETKSDDFYDLDPNQPGDQFAEVNNAISPEVEFLETNLPAGVTRATAVSALVAFMNTLTDGTGSCF